MLRYLESELDIYIDAFEYKYEDIKDLIQGLNADLEVGSSCILQGTSSNSNLSAGRRQRPLIFSSPPLPQGSRSTSGTSTAPALSPTTPRTQGYGSSDRRSLRSELTHESHELDPLARSPSISSPKGHVDIVVQAAQVENESPDSEIASPIGENSSSNRLSVQSHSRISSASEIGDS